MGSNQSSTQHDGSEPEYSGHKDISVTQSIDQMRTVPHMQPGSLRLDYTHKYHQAVELQFQVHAPKPCRVTTFSFASEDRYGTIDSEAGAVLAINCSPGLDLQFPGTSFKHAFKVHDICNKHLTPTDGTYPVVIRIESLASKYSSYGLDSLPHPGAPLQHYANTHTIFAKIVFSHSGTWSIEVVKQHLWLSGVPYILPTTSLLEQFKQALYIRAPVPSILSPVHRPAKMLALPAQSQNQQAFPDTPLRHRPRSTTPAIPACTICHTRAVSVLSSPCRHACMCGPCAVKQRQQYNCCPMCFQTLDDLVLMRAAEA